MGVKSFMSFMEKSFNGWQTREINGYLVIDGNNLIFNLHKLDWAYGGQYPQFYEECHKYFKTLKRNGIVPIVVFDGVDYDQQKVATVMRRRKETIERMHKGIAEVRANSSVHQRSDSIPLVCNIIMYHVLTELNIQHYHTDGEADAAIVHIANYYSCPVLSYDSDFFLYDLKGGYISSKTFHWRATPITAEVYFVEAFAEQFHLRHKSLRCVIPAIVGNDFLSPCSSRGFIEYISEENGRGSSHPICPIVRFAAHFDDLDHFICEIDKMDCPINKKRLQSNCREARNMYDDGKTQKPAELMKATVLKNKGGCPIPMWVIEEFRIGNILSDTMEAVVLGRAVLRNAPDDTSQLSACVSSQPLRQYIYGLFELESVTEVFRHCLDLSGEEVEAFTMVDSKPLPTLADIAKLRPLEREWLLYSILHCDCRVMDTLDMYWKFVVCSLVYWTTAGNVPEHLVKALLLCFLICSYFNEKELRTLRDQWRMTREYHRSKEWLNALHHFAQWQHIYFDAKQLNSLLRHPLKAVCPAFLFDGKIALYIAGSRDIDYEGQTASRIKSVSRNLFRELLHTVMKQVHPHRRAAESGHRRRTESRGAPRGRYPNSMFPHNRFAPLSRDCTD